MATARSSFWRRASAALGLSVAATLTLPVVSASASPKPDLKTEQKKLQDLSVKVDDLTQQYDKASEDLTKAQKQLQVYQQQVAANKSVYDSLRQAVAQMAAAAYKNSGGDETNVMGRVLDAQNPTALLDQMTVVTAVSKDRTSALARFVNVAQSYKRALDAQAQTVDNITKTKASLKSQAENLRQLTTKQARLVIAAGGPAPNQGTCHVTAATDKAQTAVNFACSQLGQPYLWGGTGPLYDCSGLTQAAWGRAGISLPRTTYEQWNAGSRVGYDQLQPGDLVFFDASLGHVGMYLGGGKMIHDPHTGDVVKVSDISSGYYQSAFQGGVHIS